MTKDEYCYEVRKVLEDFQDSVVSKLNNIFRALPPNARGMTIEIFVDQDGEGFLDISVSLDGPDLYILNDQIASDRELFSTRMTAKGLDPPLPLMGRPELFSVNDVLTDCAADWLVWLWLKVVRGEQDIPVYIVSHDEYGVLCPINLK